MKSKLHYAWLICFLCVMAMFCTMGLTSNTFSIYINAFIEENGFSGAQGSSLTTVRCLASLLGMLIIGRYYDILDVKKGLSLSVAFVACAFFIYSQAHSIYVFYIGAFLAGLGYGLGTMVPVTIITNRWFATNQGLALGCASAGTGIATMVAPPLINAALEYGGVAFAASVEGGLVLLLAAAMFFLLRNTPADMNMKPYGTDRLAVTAAKAQAQADTPPEIVSKEPPVLGRLSDILLLVAMFLIGASTTPTSESLAVHMTTSGVPLAAAAVAISIDGFFMTIGKLIYGSLVDRIGSYRSNYIFAASLVGGLFLAFFINGNIAFTYVCVLFMGFGFAINTVAISVWALHFYPSEEATKRLRYFWVATLSGGIVCTPLPGIVYDITGSYKLFYLAAAIAYAIVAIIVQSHYHKRTRLERAMQA